MDLDIPQEQKEDKLAILTSEELADKLRIKPQTLRDWRLNGYGPRFTKPRGTRGFYRVADVLAWFESCE